MRFQDRCAFITGAASGMGLLCSECFAREGGNVLMTDVNPETLEAAVAQVNALGVGRAVGVVCDVLQYDQICAARDRAVAEFGRIDLLVNFAGGAATRIRKLSGEFPDMPIEDLDWGLDVNLKGQFHCDHAVLKVMRAQKSGVIINIGSITGEEGSPTAVDYSAAKSGAMYGLTKSIALYGAKYGIRCCCVAPGPVLTRANMANMRTLLGRAADPQEIVDLVLYLASDQAAFITGINILADGGRNLLWDKTFRKPEKKEETK